MILKMKTRACHQSRQSVKMIFSFLFIFWFHQACLANDLFTCCKSQYATVGKQFKVDCTSSSNHWLIVSYKDGSENEMIRCRKGCNTTCSQKTGPRYEDGTQDIEVDGILLFTNVTEADMGNYTLEYADCDAFHDSISFSLKDGSNKFPSVNGSYNQQHVVFMDVSRVGKLNCSVDRVVPNAYLEWDYTNHDVSSQIALERQSHFSVDNGDGTHNITSVTSYKTIGQSIQYATLKCVVSGRGALLYPLFTTVELHFPSLDGRYNFPLVNELDSRQHVYLEVNREGTLNCSMNSVSPNIKLAWDFTNNYSFAEIALEKLSHSSFDKGDGAYNIELVSTYKTKSKSVQYAIMRCMVSGKAAYLYPLFTTVELHFPAADSVSSCRLTEIPVCIAFIVVAVLAFVIGVIIGVIIGRRRRQKCERQPERNKQAEGELLLESTNRQTCDRTTSPPADRRRRSC